CLFYVLGDGEGRAVGNIVTQYNTWNGTGLIFRCPSVLHFLFVVQEAHILQAGLGSIVHMISSRELEEDVQVEVLIPQCVVKTAVVSREGRSNDLTVVHGGRGGSNGTIAYDSPAVGRCGSVVILYNRTITFPEHALASGRVDTDRFNNFQAANRFAYACDVGRLQARCGSSNV